jgi:DNA-binding CsgD family transcriptional regulator
MTDSKTPNKPAAPVAMHKVLQDYFEPVLNAPSKEVLRNELVKFAKRQGFDLALAQKLSRKGENLGLIHNHSNAWLNATKLLTDDEIDNLPTHTSLTVSSMPLLWDQDSFIGQPKNVREAIEQVRAMGFESGIDIPLHQSDGSVIVIALTRDKALPDDPEELMRIVGETQVFAAIAQSSVTRFIVTAASPTEPLPQALSPKELTVLNWTKEGKTAWEIGQILSITERTVNFHVQNILQKFNVANKQSAVLKALQFGMIQP